MLSIQFDPSHEILKTASLMTRMHYRPRHFFKVAENYYFLCNGTNRAVHRCVGPTDHYSWIATVKDKALFSSNEKASKLCLLDKAKPL